MGSDWRQKPELQLARHRQIALQALFLKGDLFVEPRILNRNRNLRRQCGYGAFVIVGEKAATRVFEVQHSNHFVLVDQRHRQFGAGLRIRLDIARVLVHVGHQNRLLMLRGVTHDASAQWDFVFELDVLLEALREAVL